MFFLGMELKLGAAFCRGARNSKIFHNKDQRKAFSFCQDGAGGGNFKGLQEFKTFQGNEF